MMKLSIIVPTFHTEPKLLYRCIESLLDQSYDNYEIIIIDDGNDEAYRNSVYSAEILKDERIRVVFQVNSGVSAARNEGVRLAEGDYVAFVDADDIVSRDFAAESVKAAGQSGADVVIGGMIRLKNGALLIPDGKEPECTLYQGETKETVEAMMIGQHYYIKGSQGKAYVGRGPVARIIKSDLAGRALFDTSLKMYEDTVWNVDIVHLAGKICVVDSVWYGYYDTADSASKGFHTDEIERSTKGMRVLFDRLDCSRPAVCKAFSEQCILEYGRIMKTYFLNRQNKQSILQKLKESRQMIHSTPWDFLTYRNFKALDRRMRLRGLLYISNTWLLFKSIKGLLK